MTKCFIVQDGSSTLKVFRIEDREKMLNHFTKELNASLATNKKLFGEIMDENYKSFKGSLTATRVEDGSGGFTLYLASILPAT